MAAVIAAATVLVPLGCGGEEPSAQLRALRADPLASWEPPQAALAEESEQSEGETTLGKPQLARVRRLFALQGSAENAFEAAVAAAEKAGWRLDGEPIPSTFGGRVALARRELDTGSARLSISVLTDRRLLPEDVPPPALLILLEHVGS